MQKKAIIEILHSNHQDFFELLDTMELDAFEYSKNGKWSPGQHLAHIVSTLSPVRMAMGLPLFLIAWRVGKANRPSRTYEELVARYREKLSLGGKAPARFVPPAISLKDKQRLIQQSTRLLGSLITRIERRQEQELDAYILPHPLLGKITLREMLFFTAYHVEHHRQLILRDVRE
jgi:hypothetical protein